MSALLVQYGPLIAGFTAIALAVWRVLAKVRKDGINQAKVDSYEKSIKDVERAAQAGARVGTASGERMPIDPYDRDRR